MNLTDLWELLAQHPRLLARLVQRFGFTAGYDWLFGDDGEDEDR